MDRLRALRTFISVAEHASFAEAARRLSTSPSAVTRTIAALEASVGVALFMRTTRTVRLTTEGMAFLERCRAGVAEIDLAFDEARGRSSVPRGMLTVTAPVMFGRLHVLPIVTELLALHPQLQVRLLLLDRVVNLVDEGVDIAVRIADLDDSSLHMLRIGTVRRVLSASPEYLERRGVPMSVAELRDHELIVLDDEMGWRSDTRAGMKIEPRLSVNSVEAAISAALAGLGLVRTLSYQVDEHLAAGTLRAVLADRSEPALPVSLLFQRGRVDRPNVRAFVNAARQRLNGMLV